MVLAASKYGAVATSITGSRSFSVSYCRFIRYGLTECVSNTTSQVLPSGGDLATVVVPAAPDAPGLFSMMMLVPRRCCSPVCTRRASASVEPPGGKGTTRRIGPLGQLCAPAKEAANGAAAAPNTKLRLVSPATIITPCFLSRPGTIRSAPVAAFPILAYNHCKQPASTPHQTPQNSGR